MKEFQNIINPGKPKEDLGGCIQRFSEIELEMESFRKKPGESGERKNAEWKGLRDETEGLICKRTVRSEGREGGRGIFV